MASLLSAAVVCLLFAAVACSNGSEGDRCEFDNGNDDCQDGLVCIPATPRQGAPFVVNPPYNNSDRCCPLDRTTATHPACIELAGGTSDSGIPDATPGDTGTPDVSVDSADAADADSGQDAADAAEGG